MILLTGPVYYPHPKFHVIPTHLHLTSLTLNYRYIYIYGRNLYANFLEVI